MGENGAIFRVDDFNNWTPQDSGLSWDLRSVFAHPDGHMIWAAEFPKDGNVPRMIQSLDAGDTWEVLDFRQSPAYWVWLAWALLLLFSGYYVFLRFKPDGAPPFPETDGTKKLGIEGRGASDKPVGLEQGDTLKFGPIALGLSRFIRNRDTSPPLTFAITGGWGTGKSSLMKMVLDDLRLYGARPVWFNAWHHQTEKHLMAALLENIRSQAIPPFWTVSGLRFRGWLAWIRTKGDLKAAFAWLVIISLAATVMEWVATGNNLYTADFISKFTESEVPTGIAGGGSIVIGLLGFLRKRVRSISISPARLMAATSGKGKSRDLSAQLGYRHKFGQEFSQVCRALRRVGHSPCMVLVIDDLDRCQSKGVLEILEAVNFLVTVAECFILLGIDRDQVEKSVRLKFKDSIETFVEKKDGNNGGEHLRDFARQYLEKLINIEIPVPALTEQASREMWSAPATGNEQNTWRARK